MRRVPCLAPGRGRKARLRPPSRVPCSRAGVIPDLWGSAGGRCVSGHRVSRPTLIFDGVECLSSETEKRGHYTWVIRCAGLFGELLAVRGLRRLTVL